MPASTEPDRYLGVTGANQRGRLEIRVAEAAGDLERRTRVPIHLLGRGGAFRAREREPSLLGYVSRAAEKTLGPSDPSGAHRFVAVGGANSRESQSALAAACRPPPSRYPA